MENHYGKHFAYVLLLFYKFDALKPKCLVQRIQGNCDIDKYKKPQNLFCIKFLHHEPSQNKHECFFNRFLSTRTTKETSSHKIRKYFFSRSRKPWRPFTIQLLFFSFLKEEIDKFLSSSRMRSMKWKHVKFSSQKYFRLKKFRHKFCLTLYWHRTWKLRESDCLFQLIYIFHSAYEFFFWLNEIL